ncbi:GDSL esterase/lipase [Trifolium repens]|nr:GDSL esterase/lipase [Trifolium repens]
MELVGEKLRQVMSYVIISTVLTLVIVSSCSVIEAKKCSFPAIFNFGDSNSDTGGLSAAFGQVRPPNGITFFHTPAGRYCDGRLVIDFLAQNLGLPYLSAYLESVGSNFSNGANFATAGSTIRPQNKTLSQSGYSPISLDVQLVEYSDFKARSIITRKKGGVFKKLLPKEEYFAKALYTFDIGHNDITAGYNLDMTTEQVKAYIPDVLDQFSNVIKCIYKEGGRSFWIHNVGPIGCLAYMLDRYPMSAAQTDKFGCAKPFNEVAQYYNDKLNKTVVQLREEVPKATIVYVDVYTVKYTLISHAQKYGFDEEAVIACCGHGGISLLSIKIN